MRWYMLSLSLLLCLSAFSQIEEDLSLHYKFDNDLLDASESMIHGTQQGGDLLYDEGVEGNSINFSEQGEHVFIDTTYQLELPFSISVWVKPQDLSRAWQTTISKYQVAFYGSFWFGLHFDKANMWLPVGNGQEVFYDSQTALLQNEWNHIVWVCDDTNEGRMYINGEPDAAMGFIPDVFQNADSLMLGRQALFLDITDDHANYLGRMDDLRVYSKVLRDDDVEHLFKMTSSIDHSLAETPQIFPNPSSGVFNLIGLSQNSVLKVYDSIGRIVLFRKLNTADHIFDLSNLGNGIYYCNLQSTKNISTFKLQVF